MTLLYSQCWEDPELLTGALQVGFSDDVLSIASAGDNTFALLGERPHSIVAIDRSLAQLHLAELKMSAMEHLDYDTFVAFVGARPCDHRLKLYRDFRPALSWPARSFWDAHRSAIATGLIHCGRLERYLARFRRYLLPLVLGRHVVDRLLEARDTDEQRRVYEELWDSARWRALFRCFFSRPVMAGTGRSRAFFRHVEVRDTAARLLERTRTGLTRVPARGNYFLEYMLTGGYRDLESAPPYLRQSRFEAIRSRLWRVRLVHSDLNHYLETLQPDSISRFNLSDVFEYMSQAEQEKTWRNVLRAAAPGSRFACWSLFVPCPGPAPMLANGRPIETVIHDDRTNDRTFFYDRFMCWEAG